MNLCLYTFLSSSAIPQGLLPFPCDTRISSGDTPAHDRQCSVAQAANDREILLTSCSLGCFSIASLWLSAWFWGAELSPSPLQLVQRDVSTTTSQVPGGKGKHAVVGSVVASLAAQAEERGNCLHMVRDCPKQRNPRAERLGWVLSTSCALPRAEIMRKRNCML